eukprot:scaffold99924_cov36-Attheya_sp.AAC.2
MLVVSRSGGVVARSLVARGLLRTSVVTSRALSTQHSEVFEKAKARAQAFDDKYGLDLKPLELIASPYRVSPSCPHEAQESMPQKPVPTGVELPVYAETGGVPESDFSESISLQAADDPDFLHNVEGASQMARMVLIYACEQAVPGRMSDELSHAVYEALVANNAYPSWLNYASFPKSMTVSVNDVVVQGIPDTYPFQKGDVVSLDVSAFMGGVHGDNAATVVVGDWPDEIPDSFTQVHSDFDKSFDPGHDWRGIPYRTEFESDEQRLWMLTGRRLVKANIEALNAGWEAATVGSNIADIGAAISDVADAYGYDVVRSYRGRGIGTEFHCAPFVKHFRNDDSVELEAGMIFTIEPAFTEGYRKCHPSKDDKWAVITNDGGRSSQFAHTIMVTEEGPRKMTQSEDSIVQWSKNH